MIAGDVTGRTSPPLRPPRAAGLFASILGVAFRGTRLVDLLGFKLGAAERGPRGTRCLDETKDMNELGFELGFDVTIILFLGGDPTPNYWQGRGSSFRKTTLP